MWFNNTLIYQFTLEKEQELSTLLAEEALTACPPHARFTYGWLPVSSQGLVHEIAGSSFVCLGKEERILPRAVITKFLAEKIQTIENQQGRSVKRAEKAQLAEDLEFELLPKSFCIQKRWMAFLDNVSKRLIINTASPNQAAQLTSLLRKSIPGITIEPFHHAENLASCFAEWINNPEILPSHMQLASDCVLFSLDNDKKRINCRGYELPAEEVITLLAQGMATAEISLIWKERIQFTLTQDFIFKKLKSLDFLIDDFNELRTLEEGAQQEDAALTLLAGELRELVNDVQAVLTKQNKCRVTLAKNNVECVI